MRQRVCTRVLLALLVVACNKNSADDQPSAAATNAAVADTGRDAGPTGNSIPSAALPLGTSGAWLDTHLRAWNVAGSAVPKAPPPSEPGVYAATGRCHRALPASASPSASPSAPATPSATRTPKGKRARAAAKSAAKARTKTKTMRVIDSAAVASATEAVTRAGWTLVNTPQVVRGIVIITAAVDADGMCRPFKYQTFVFINGTYAGTLSPHTMDSRTDGDLMSVTVKNDQEILASFKRYKESDPLCCASRRTVVHYRVEREGGHPIVVPAETKTTSNRTSSASRT